MTWFTGIIAYLLIWWTALFAILPWGIRHDHAVDPAERAPGAPLNPGLKKKFFLTTLVSFVLWLILYGLIEAEVIDFRAISMSMMAQDNM